MEKVACQESTPIADGLVLRREHGLIVLSSSQRSSFRRILYVNCYGGTSLWDRMTQNLMPAHHLWGCLELAHKGYEVALAEPLPDFYLYRKPLPHDARYFNFIRSWLGKDGIVYCGHNVLYWVPLLSKLGVLKCRVVSLLYAREPLAFSRAHQGIIALNPAAAEHARHLSPKAKVVCLAWGVDVRASPHLPFRPDWLLSCGRTQRDDHTLLNAASKTSIPVRVITGTESLVGVVPPNVDLVRRSDKWERRMTHSQLIHDFYSRSGGSLIILKEDTAETTACGFTNLLEAMSMARPVIVTRTGAVPSEIDVERAGCGFHVPPGDPVALARAMEKLVGDPEQAKAMGEAGRRLCESRYNIDRYGEELHAYFETL